MFEVKFDMPDFQKIKSKINSIAATADGIFSPGTHFTGGCVGAKEV